MKLYYEAHPGQAAVRRQSGTVLGWILFWISAVMFAYAAFQITTIVTEDAAAGKASRRAQAFTSGSPAIDDNGAADARTDPTSQDAAALLAAASDDFTVDFEGLARTASDTAAWIRIPGTDINYPVLQGSDNDYYLRHSPDGGENRAGSIFIDYRISADFSDRNTILYGHRMNNGSMFAQLHEFEDDEFRRAHPYVYINRPDGSLLTYRVFAVYEPGYKLSDHPYQIAWKNKDEFLSWCREDRERPYYYDSSQSFAEDNHILTLSTCVRADGSRRFIVQAKLISNTERAPV